MASMNKPPPPQQSNGLLQVAQEVLGWLLSIAFAALSGFHGLRGDWKNGLVMLAIALILYPLNRLPDQIRFLLILPVGVYLFAVISG